ncbi:MAG: phosphoglycerate dehydrogenase, partial [Parvularculaceae bacterium]
MPKVLISDALSDAAVNIFKERGVEVDYLPDLGKDKEKLLAVIGGYDGLAVRSATKATAPVIKAGTRLKVIGRAGIGVDNVDIPAATAAGIVVMNTPYGNAVTTAEHAIAMMFALARQLPQASSSTHAGKWEKNRFMGVELYGKTLGVIGCGNIGSFVAERAIGLKLRVIAYDPYLTDARAVELGVQRVDLPALLERADLITLHTPLTDQTRNILSAENLRKTKKGVFIVNCARGGLVDEAALKELLDDGHVAGAGLDVFAEEPATSHPLFGHERVVATPHLGASTREAQENVAIQIAEQMSDYLMRGAVLNSLNSPSITAEESPRLKPIIRLAEHIGLSSGLEPWRIAVGHTYRSSATVRLLKHISQQKLFGNLREMSFEFGGLGRILTGGGYLGDAHLSGGGAMYQMGSHYLDALLYISNATDVALGNGRMEQEVGIDIHTEAELLVACSNGPRVPLRLLVTALRPTKNIAKLVYDHATISTSLGNSASPLQIASVSG